MVFTELHLPSPDPEGSLSYYQDVLGFGIENGMVKAGHSGLKFIRDESTAPYHIAFNIPVNLLNQALAWLKPRVDVLTYQGDHIVDFPNWKAKALYFYDLHQNILEFIAREDVGEINKTEFDSDSILSVSEMSIVTDDLQKDFFHLEAISAIDQYSGNLETFCAAGDPEGLFIMVARERKWFMSDIRAYPVKSKVIFKNGKSLFSLNTNNDGQLTVEELQ